MDISKYLEEKQRMCKNYSLDAKFFVSCSETCPFFKGRSYKGMLIESCEDFQNKFPGDCAILVEKWSKEHPVNS